MLFDPLTKPEWVFSTDIAEPVESPSKQPEDLVSKYLTDMAIFNNILNLFPMNNDFSLLNIDEFPDHIVVYLREFTNATPVYFNVDLIFVCLFVCCCFTS